MADKRQLTDRFLRSLPPAKHGTRNDIWDSVVPTFGACVYDSKDSDPSRRGKAGRIAFFMFTRFKRGAAPARRIIGTYGAITLEDARRTAGEWRSLIGKGIDPAAVEKANREKYNTASWHRRAAHGSRTCHRRGRSMREHGMLKRSQNVPIGGPVLACFDPSGLD